MNIYFSWTESYTHQPFLNLVVFPDILHLSEIHIFQCTHIQPGCPAKQSSVCRKKWNVRGKKGSHCGCSSDRAVSDVNPHWENLWAIPQFLTKQPDEAPFTESTGRNMVFCLNNNHMNTILYSKLSEYKTPLFQFWRASSFSHGNFHLQIAKILTIKY